MATARSLAYLGAHKQVDGRGLELSMARVRAAVTQGLSVIQGNLETDLKDYPSGAFDYAILSQTLQATHKPRVVLEQLLRIGRRAIISFPNFAHWRVRLSVMFGGRMPVTTTLAETWYDTPNIHLCTILDFVDLCHAMDVRIERGLALNGKGLPRGFSALAAHANFFQRTSRLRFDPGLAPRLARIGGARRNRARGPRRGGIERHAVNLLFSFHHQNAGEGWGMPACRRFPAS